MDKTTASILYTSSEIHALLDVAIKGKFQVQALFNQGKYVYNTRIVTRDDSFLWLDFDGIEESTLMGLIDFYSPTVFVFSDETKRYQALARQGLLAPHEGRTCLRVSIPSSVSAVPGRKSERVDLPDGHASLLFEAGGEQRSLAIREVSLGGLSTWAPSSLNLVPHGILRNAKISFVDGFSFPCSIEIVRLVYTLDEIPGRSHLISMKFDNVADKELAKLKEYLAALRH